MAQRRNVLMLIFTFFSSFSLYAAGQVFIKQEPGFVFQLAHSEVLKQSCAPSLDLSPNAESCEVLKLELKAAHSTTAKPKPYFIFVDFKDSEEQRRYFQTFLQSKDASFLIDMDPLESCEPGQSYEAKSCKLTLKNFEFIKSNMTRYMAFADYIEAKKKLTRLVALHANLHASSVGLKSRTEESVRCALTGDWEAFENSKTLRSNHEKIKSLESEILELRAQLGITTGEEPFALSEFEPVIIYRTSFDDGCMY